MNKSKLASSLLITGFVVGFLLVLWEVLIIFRPNMEYVASSPSAIASACIDRFPRLLFHMTTTLKTILFSLTVSSVASLPFAFIMYRCTSLSLVMQFFFVVFESVPTFCLAPILIMWFGWGKTSAMVPCVLSALLTQTLMLWRALKETPSHFHDYFAVLGASAWTKFWKFEFPYTLPSFFSGMRIAAAISGVSAIASEWAGQEAGLGVLILETKEEVDMAGCFAALLSVLVLSALMYSITALLEKIVQFRFRPFLQKGLALLLLFVPLHCFSEEIEGKPYTLALDWIPCPTHVPFYAGKAWNIFQEEGVDITLVKPGMVDPLQMVLSGEIDICLTSLTRAITRKAKGDPLEIIGSFVEKPLKGFLCKKNVKLFQGDGKERVIGFVGSIFSSRLLGVFLKRGGWTGAQLIQVRADLVSRLVSGSIDVAYGVFKTIEPFHCKSLGMDISFVGVEELGFPPYHELVLVSLKNGRLIQQNKVFNFQRALQKSIDRSIKEESVAFHAYLNVFPDKNERTRQWEKEAWVATQKVLTRKQELPQEMLDTLVQWLSKEQIISSSSLSAPYMAQKSISVLHEEKNTGATGS